MLHASDESLAISQGYAHKKYDNYLLSPDDIVYYVLYTYALIMESRKSQGNFVQTMSRKEYQDNKPEGFPDYWVLSNAVGGWNNILKIIPISVEEKIRRNRRGDDASIEKFHHILTLVAIDNGVRPLNVSVQQFSRFKKDNPQLDIANWKVYARYISGEEKWSETKNIAISTMGRRKMLYG